MAVQAHTGEAPRISRPDTPVDDRVVPTEEALRAMERVAERRKDLFERLK